MKKRPKVPRSHADIIETWPDGIAGFGSAIGASPGNVRVMKHRNRIPPEYWAPLVLGAKHLKLPPPALLALLQSLDNPTFERGANAKARQHR